MTRPAPVVIDGFPFHIPPPGWRSPSTPAPRVAPGGFPPRTAGSLKQPSPSGGDGLGTYVTTAPCVGKHGERT